MHNGVEDRLGRYSERGKCHPDVGAGVRQRKIGSLVPLLLLLRLPAQSGYLGELGDIAIDHRTFDEKTLVTEDFEE